MPHFTKSMVILLLAVISFSGCDKDSTNNTTEPGKNIAFTAETQSPPDNSIALQFVSIDGDNLTLEINAKKVTDVYGAAFALHFDASIFEYVSASEGNFFNSNNGSTSFMAACGSGVITIGCSLLGSEVQPITGSGSICTLVFKAIENGQSRFSYRENRLFDSQGHEIADVQWFGGLGIVAD